MGPVGGLVDLIIGIAKDEMFLGEQDLLKQSKNISYYLKNFEEKLIAYFKNLSEAVYEKVIELYKPQCIPLYLAAIKPSVTFEFSFVQAEMRLN